jgi:hypothetical protein
MENTEMWNAFKNVEEDLRICKLDLLTAKAELVSVRSKLMEVSAEAAMLRERYNRTAHKLQELEAREQ